MTTAMMKRLKTVMVMVMASDQPRSMSNQALLNFGAPVGARICSSLATKTIRPSLVIWPHWPLALSGRLLTPLLGARPPHFVALKTHPTAVVSPTL